MKRIIGLVFLSLAVYSRVLPATLNLTGFETGDETKLQSLTGTASVQSGIKRTGTYAFRSNPTTTAVGWCLVREHAGNATIVQYDVATVSRKLRVTDPRDVKSLG